MAALELDNETGYLDVRIVHGGQERAARLDLFEASEELAAARAAAPADADPAAFWDALRPAAAKLLGLPAEPRLSAAVVARLVKAVDDGVGRALGKGGPAPAAGPGPGSAT